MTQDRTRLLIRGLDGIATGLPGAAARHAGPDLRLEGTRIVALGALAPEPGETVVDASGCIAYPAWVNTHHHLFQSLLKGDPAGLDCTLNPWLAQTPYRYRAAFDAEAFRIAVRVGLVELALSGCGTVADHNYLHWPGQGFDPSAILFEEAAALGLRLVLCRGGQTMLRAGVEPPRSAALQPESFDAWLRDLQRLAARWHDPAPDAMRRIVAAPTTPTFSMTPDQMRTVAQEARRLGLRLHSHLSETVAYIDAVQRQHGLSPVDFVDSLGWLGPDVWFAHLVHLSPAEITRLGATGTGIAHCPQSNGRLGSGIAPVLDLAAAGAPVSLGVDGAASNEAADMVSEAHAAWLMSRARDGLASRATVQGGVGEAGVRMATVDQVIHWGTAGGARVLGLDAVGTLAPGQAADIALFNLDRDPRGFGLHDRLAAPVVGGGRAHLARLFVAGREVVRDGTVPGLDLPALGREAARQVRRLQAAARG